MRALLLSFAILVVAAPAAAAQEVIDRAAEALHRDPVYVDRGAPGVISEDEADELRERVRELPPGSLFVSVLPEVPSTEPEDVVLELANRLGISSTHAVLVGNSFRVAGTAEARRAADEAFAAHRSDGPAAVLLDFVDRMPGGREPGGEEGGDGAGAGALVLLGLVGAGGAALLVARRRRRREEEAEFAEVKENARDDLVALGEEIRALDLDIEMPAVGPEARADYERAVNAYERADAAWQRARGPEDLEPVGAALEEGRWAMGCARARLAGRPPPERRAPCFFDPRHGPSDRDVEWAPEYGTPRLVPACEADAQRVERGEDPHAREVLVGGQRMPYWNAGPMYAPFAGGFFGGGLLPGMVMGTMLGDVFDAPAAGGGDSGGGDFGGGDFGGGDFGGGDFGGGDF
jgi:hypothetical protein